MILPSNIDIVHIAKNKENYENFIKRNINKIEGILILLNTKPFNGSVNTDKYYEYTLSICKKYNIKAIGFFNEANTSKFSKSLNKDILNFKIEFSYYYKSIKTIIRPYTWYDFSFYEYDNLNFHIPSEENSLYVARTFDLNLFFENLEFLENGIDTSFKKKELLQSKYAKRISFAHSDSTKGGKLFYEYFKNSDDKFISEIDDIYFAQEFIYDNGTKYLSYGNVMGVNASNEQVQYLFKIQQEFGISISLTLNALNPPLDLLYDTSVLKEFLLFIKKFYDQGLRVCTISDVHLIKTGVLQKHFPLMKFKNTVNHKIYDAQGFINYANLGYEYIQLDRSLARNMAELKRIKKANEKYNKKLYLLASEYCMYECPFKSEHDLMNEQIQNSIAYFVGENKLSHISCDNWRNTNSGKLPRIGVDILFKDENMANDYLSNINVLKLSGRLTVLDNIFDSENKFYVNGFKSFEDKVKLDMKKEKVTINYKEKPYYQNKSNIYASKEGQNLLDILTNCKNQCYDCHKCEDVFKIDHFDSLIDIK